GAVDPFAVPAAVILLVFEEPVDVLLIKQFAPDALVGHTGARGLPDLRRRAEEITFDLPAQGGAESSSQSASRASTIVDPLHPVTSRTGGDLGQRLLLRAEAWKHRRRKNSPTGLTILVRELSGSGRGTRSPDLTIMSRAL